MASQDPWAALDALQGRILRRYPHLQLLVEEAVALIHGGRLFAHPLDSVAYFYDVEAQQFLAAIERSEDELVCSCWKEASGPVRGRTPPVVHGGRPLCIHLVAHLMAGRAAVPPEECPFSAEALWNRTLADLRLSVLAETYDWVFTGSRGMFLRHGTLHVATRTAAAAAWMSGPLGALVHRAVLSASGCAFQCHFAARVFFISAARSTPPSLSECEGDGALPSRGMLTLTKAQWLRRISPDAGQAASRRADPRA